MSGRKISLYIKDILNAIISIENFTSQMDRAEFEKDDKTCSATLRKFEIIGEATKKIPKEIRAKYKQIPWKEMAKMRDKLIHFYFGIDYEIIWNTIKTDLPQLKKDIKKVLQDVIKAENEN